MRTPSFIGISLSGIAIAASLLSQQVSAQTQDGNGESSARKIKTTLEKRQTAIQLSAGNLRNYESFKSALSPLVVVAYKPFVRTTDSGFIDAVLRPIYGNLILRKIDGDQRFRQQAALTGASAKFDILQSGEILLYQQVSFTPNKVFSCTDRSRSDNLLCVKSAQELAPLEADYRKNPDPTLETSIKIFKAKYKENPGLTSRLRGWDLQKMSTLQAAYTGLAAMPQARERGAKFMPAAVFAYAKPRDGSGTPSGQTGPGVPGTTPGTDIPRPGGGRVAPGQGNVRSETPHEPSAWNAFDTRKLDGINQPELVAFTGSTEGLFNTNDLLAWAVSDGGATTRYELLNGFTNNHRASISDRWNIVCIDYNPVWPGCTQYWFGFELGYGYVYGIRAGFNVTTSSRLTDRENRSGRMTISMDTGNKDSDLFRDSKLRNQDIFDGKELLARLCQQNSCFAALLGDLPGPDPLSTRFTRWTFDEIDFLKKLPTCLQVRRKYGQDLQCSALDLMREGEYAWPNASSTVNLARWIAPVDLFGGQLNYGVAGAEANPYLALNTAGKGYRQNWRTATGTNQAVNSRSSNLTFNFNRVGNSASPLITGIDNEYDFNFSITPGISLKGQAAGYGLGPRHIDIDALAIESPTFTLFRHSGTWNGAWTGVPSR